MLATPEIIDETGHLAPWEELLPRWRQIPLYRALLSGFSHLNDRRLAGLPFLTKREIRQDFPQNFLSSREALDALVERNEVEVEYTSGTSEERTTVMFPKGWWDAQEKRVLRLNSFVAGVLDEYPEARRVTLTTPACNGQACPVVWQSAAQRTFGLSRFVNLSRIPFVLSDAELGRMADEILEWSPQFLDLSPVHGARFALYCEQHGLRFPSLRFILCSYEFVSVVHRRILDRVFGVPVFNLYGSTETGHLLMEDENGDMKASRENAILEILEPDTRGIGDLVVTTLTNDLMPLLRYRIGDLVARNEESDQTTYRVHGRIRDALLGGDGRRITTWEVDQCFVGVNGLLQYQLIQETSGAAKLRYVPEGKGPTPVELNELTARLEALLEAPSKIETESMPVLSPTHSGKFRLTSQAG